MKNININFLISKSFKPDSVTVDQNLPIHHQEKNID